MTIEVLLSILLCVRPSPLVGPLHPKCVFLLLWPHRFRHYVQLQDPEEARITLPAAAIPVVKRRPAMPRGELLVLQELFATGASTAPIRKQCLDFGLGLLAADQLEQATITTAAELTDSNIRLFQTKLKVRHRISCGSEIHYFLLIFECTAHLPYQ